MTGKYLRIERHPRDEISKDLYLVWLQDESCLDEFVRHFFMINRIEYNFEKKRWVFRKHRRKRKGV